MATLREQVAGHLEHARTKGYMPLFEAAAREHGVLLSFLLGIASQESGCGSFFKNYPPGKPWMNAGGDGGIMQINKDAHPNYYARYSTENAATRDHRANIRYGASYLRQCVDAFKGRYDVGACAYNAGPGAVRSAINRGQSPDLPTTGTYGADVVARARVVNEILSLGENPGVIDLGGYTADVARPDRHTYGPGITLDEGLLVRASDMGDVPDEMLRTLSVRPGEDETAELVELPPPVEGEYDIGDLRFGSELQVRATGRFRSPNDTELNQPTSVTQQNVGSVGLVELLRTDMSAVVGENRVLPEVSLRLTLNATFRDDVNRLLRPLVAQARRLPFLVARNADLARLMLGVGPNRSVAEYIQEQSPQLYAEYKSDPKLMAELEALQPNQLWVPVTLRSIYTQSQAGAKDLYQVTINLQYANVLPYVPRLLFWKTTKDALEWARYLAYRSDHGALPTSVMEGTANILFSSGHHVRVSTPKEMAAHQTESPYRSYVFKKWWRGLLEEYQGGEFYGLYRGLVAEKRFSEIEPIGMAAADLPLYPRPGMSEEERRGYVYEPAYPMSDPVRLMERYDPQAVMGLGYITASDLETRQARMARLEQRFAERLSQIKMLQSAARVYGTTAFENDQVGALGTISPLAVALGHELSLMMATFSMTVDQLGRVLTNSMTALAGKHPDLRTNVYKFEVSTDGEVRIVSQEGALIVRPEHLAHSIVRAYSFLSEGGPADFMVQSKEHPEISLRLSGVARELQLSVISRYVQILSAIERTYSGDAAQAFFKAARENTLITTADGKPKYAETSMALMSEEFQQALARASFIPKDASGAATDPHVAELRRLREAVADLNAALYDAMQQEKVQRAQQYLDGMTRVERGYLSFANSTIDQVSVSVYSRLSDKEWDGYAHPVTQHIGGANAEVTLEISTDDELFLTQLSELKHSQTALAEMRKTRDVTPSLIDVYGQGCLLRSLGVRQLAYRSHTQFEVKDNPGTYRVQLNLLQDESTLVRVERFQRASGALGANVFNTYEVSPLFTPVLATSTDPGRLFTAASPLSLYELIRALYGSELRLPAKAPFSCAQMTTPRLLGAADYDRIPDPDTLQRRLPYDIRVRYIPRDKRTPARPNEAFSVLASFHTGDRTLSTTRVLDLNALLAPLASFLDYAHANFPQGTTRSDGVVVSESRDLALARLVGAVEQALSTSGYNAAGYIAGLLATCLMPLSYVNRTGTALDSPVEMMASYAAAYASGAAEASWNDRWWSVPGYVVKGVTGTVGAIAGAGAGLGAYLRGHASTEAYALKMQNPDNATLIVGRVLHGSGDLPAIYSTAAMALKTAVDDVARVLVSSDAFRQLYTGWLSQLRAPSGQPLALTSAADDIFNWGGLLPRAGADGKEAPGTIEALAKLFSEIRRATPTCYPDLMMPDVRDPLTLAGVVGYDFPFGPGSAFLAEDASMADYEQAEKMRLVTAVQMASVGLDVVEKNLEARDVTADAPKRAELARLVAQMRQARIAGDLARAASLEAQITAGLGETELGKAYADAVASVAPSTGSTASLTADLERLRDLGVFTGVPVANKRQLSATEYGDLLRVSLTLQYTAYVLELARWQKKPFGEALAGVASNDTVHGPNYLDMASGSVAVQQDTRLALMRQQLQSLYAASPEVIAQQVGYTDLTSEPYRKGLMDKVRLQWTRWIGMRRAFPSYSLVVTGYVGSPYFRVLSDVYTWTAVQQIQIRKMAGAPDEYCDLQLSNMRNRLSNPTDRQNLMLLSNTHDDLSIEVTHGTHMLVFLGYGPDVSQLYPFAGRVTDYMPGVVTHVTLSSYATTLNNAPNGGAGIATSGWDANRTIADALFYTLSQTDGLEGLGRGILGGIQNVLGHTDRGGEVDEYKMGVLLSLYKAFGSPGLGAAKATATGERDVQILEGVAKHFGITDLGQLLTGSPRLYENIRLGTTDRRYANMADWILGGLDERVTSGEGWGWVTPPGETCWATLCDIVRLFPDNIVTVRPYNVGVSLTELAKHPVRQTLYVGPRSGVYTASSMERLSTSAAADFIRANLDKFVSDAAATGLATGGTALSSAEGYERYRRLYMEIFFTQYALPKTLEYLGTRGGQPPFVEGIEWWRSLLDKMQGAFSTTSASALAKYDGLDNMYMDQEGITAVNRQLLVHFRHTMEVLSGISSFAGAMPAAHYLYQLALLPEALTTGQDIDDSTFQDIERSPQVARRILDAFKDDLAEIAINAQLYDGDRGGPGYGVAQSDPLIGYLQAKAEAAGYQTSSSAMRPIQEHHPLSIYTNIVANSIRATDSHPGFANQITLQFPQKPDERTTALDRPGESWAFTVQASPLLHPDFIRNDTVYFMNLRKSWADTIGLTTAQLHPIDGRTGPVQLIEELGALYDEARKLREAARQDATRTETGETINKRIAEIDAKIAEKQEQLARTPYVKPLYQTCGVNILQDRIRHMYDGDLILHGDPRIQPYHILHVWDDAKQMHGPVEAEDILHSFDGTGFYTIVKPKLVTFHRGVDQTLDVEWLDEASRFYHTVALFTRYIAGGAAAIGSFGLAGSALGTTLGGSLAGGVGTALGVSAGVVAGTVLAVVGIVAGAWWAASTGEALTEQYAGYVGDIMNTNPIIFVPLTHKMKPLVAGLTGAAGPGTIRGAIANAVDLARREGRVPFLEEWYRAYTDTKSLTTS